MRHKGYDSWTLVYFTDQENHFLWWGDFTSINPRLTASLKVTTVMTALTTWRLLLPTLANHTATTLSADYRFHRTPPVLKKLCRVRVTFHDTEGALYWPLGSCQVDGSCGSAAAGSRLSPAAGRPPVRAGWWAPRGRTRSPSLRRRCRRRLAERTLRPAGTQGAQRHTSNRSPKTC